MTRCPDCALELPVFARYCARCGRRQPRVRIPGVRAPGWILATFAAGTGVTAVAAATYGAWTADPSLQPPSAALSGGSTGVLALAAAAMVLLQSGAIAGLVRGRDWGKILATLACLGWALTCIGLPVSFAVLLSLWRPAPSRQ